MGFFAPLPRQRRADHLLLLGSARTAGIKGDAPCRQLMFIYNTPYIIYNIIQPQSSSPPPFPPLLPSFWAAPCRKTTAAGPAPSPPLSARLLPLLLPRSRVPLLSRGSSAPVLLAPPPATIPLAVTTAAISSSCHRSGEPRDLSQHRKPWPHKTRGEPRHLTHWHRGGGSSSPPSRWAAVWGEEEEMAVLILGVCSGGCSSPWPPAQQLGFMGYLPRLFLESQDLKIASSAREGQRWR